MQYLELKNKAKKQGLRVTKTVKGKRVKLTPKELRAKISMNFENSVKNAQKVIRVCQTIIVPTRSVGAPPPPPPPPPQRRPVVNAGRAKLMAELKNILKKRGVVK
jgi:hypothetical protein|tara:strand:- start:281 stop:595 length:315 start_codon:yes stop_codon:yes gene_type:complete